ncbi:hypothetical protein M0R45_008909 [Rubus argutus]|uniref:Uncharacterized protein n=1 Tax=Rubus argutus TaxID=59490 RepID=A0AAW1Y2N1_RUBAR
MGNATAQGNDGKGHGGDSRLAVICGAGQEIHDGDAVLIAAAAEAGCPCFAGEAVIGQSTGSDLDWARQVFGAAMVMASGSHD